MADRYDPKVTVRPVTDRKGSDTHQGPASSDDPLFELARIVSGRSTGAPTPAAAAPSSPRGRPAPAPEPARPAAPEPDILGDLEAELLSDLQASFAAVKEAIEPVRPEPAPEARAPSAPSHAAAPPPLPTVEPVRPPQPAASAPPLHPSPQPHAAPPAQQPAQPRVSAAARPPLQPAPSHQPPASVTPAQHEPASVPMAAVPTTPKKVETGNFNLRPTAAPHVRVTAAPPVPTPTPEKPAVERPLSAAAKPSRWDKPAEPPKPQGSAASRFAPPRAANQAPSPGLPAPPPAADEEGLPFGEGLPFAQEGEDAADEFPLDAFDIVPGYGDDTEVPPYPEDDELEPLRKRGVPRSLVMIAGILAVVLIGVLGFVMLRPASEGGGTPPIISADAGPTKIAPPEPPATGTGDQQNKLIYDRVDSESGGGAADTKLVTPGSDPIAPVPSTDTNNPIARVILPGAPGDQGPASADAGDAGNAGENGAAVASNDASAESIGPRKVRTVIVRPDGTIVSSDAVAADGSAPASTDAAPTAPTTADVPAVPDVPSAPPAATNDDTAAIAGGSGGQELAITPNPSAAAAAAATPAPPAPEAQAQAQAPAPAPTRPVPPQPKPTPPKVVATGGDGGPIDLTPGTGKSTEVAAVAPGGQGGTPALAAAGMMVQVSSQRTEDAAQATFRDLQTRYPGILGGYGANIQKADLGDRGTYYRVRVGPFSSADAQNVCGQLKSAGGDCILAAH